MLQKITYSWIFIFAISQLNQLEAIISKVLWGVETQIRMIRFKKLIYYKNENSNEGFLFNILYLDNMDDLTE